MALNPRLIKETFSHVERQSDKAIGYFYGRLFAEHPRLRRLFPPALDAQRDRLFAALTRVVFSLDNPETLNAYLAGLGRDHRKYGVTAEHFEAVGSALITTVRKFAGEAWSAEAEAAWAAAYAAAADMMIKASQAEESPPWWDAQVVEHELRRPDIAVLTLRPGQPLPYEPGQYVSVQTTRWPRVWRTFSIANAPRPDHLLRLHVRAVPGGWVSGTLARHTKPGDTVLLGAARGSMVLDAATGDDLLCVAGGTGLAPIKALVEQVVRSGRRRGVRLLVAARTAEDLYDLPDLERLRASYPWLDVRPVIAPGTPGTGTPGTGTATGTAGGTATGGADGNVGGTATGGAGGGVGEAADGATDRAAGAAAGNGALAAAVRELAGTLPGDAYVCGPEPMTRAIATLLGELGMPTARIHHDLGAA